MVKHNWPAIARSIFAPAPANPEINAKILLHFYVGKRGFMFSRLNVGDMYGQIGSRGCTWSLATWKDPK
jgi:hypothetical protein